MEITMTELQTEELELVPAREALALFNLAAIYASNSSTALNVLAAGSTADSTAEQLIAVSQS